MPISICFRKLVLRFGMQHAGNAGMMADGFTHYNWKMSMMVAQSGAASEFRYPSKNLLEPYVTFGYPANRQQTLGQAGFKLVNGSFKDMVAYQKKCATIPYCRNIEPGDSASQAPVLHKPDQCPARFLEQVIDIELPAIVEFERPSGGDDAIASAQDAATEFDYAERGRVVIGQAIEGAMMLAKHLDAPVCCGYQHGIRCTAFAGPGIMGQS